MRSRIPLPRGALAAAGPLSLIAIGIVGYLLFGYSPGTAVAMTVLTLTTVGFSTSSRVPTGVLLFTAGLAILGVSLFAAFLGLFAAAIVEGRVSLFSRSRRMQRHVEQIADHFIVCAYGRVGRAIARELEAQGERLVVIDSKAELESDLRHDGVAYFIGNASDEQILRQAGIDRARALICAVDSDAENVYITIVARSLSPDLRIVARASQTQSADRLYLAGATHVVSPYVTSGKRMASLATRPRVVEFFDIARNGQSDVRLEELAITEGSPLVGRSMEELGGTSVPLLVRRHDGQLIANPNRQLRLEVGDIVVVFGEAADLRPLDTG